MPGRFTFAVEDLADGDGALPAREAHPQAGVDLALIGIVIGVGQESRLHGGREC